MSRLRGANLRESESKERGSWTETLERNVEGGTRHTAMQPRVTVPGIVSKEQHKT